MASPARAKKFFSKGIDKRKVMCYTLTVPRKRKEVTK